MFVRELMDILKDYDPGLEVLFLEDLSSPTPKEVRVARAEYKKDPVVIITGYAPPVTFTNRFKG